MLCFFRIWWQDLQLQNEKMIESGETIDALKRQVNFLWIQGDYLHFDEPSDLGYIVGRWLPNGV